MGRSRLKVVAVVRNGSGGVVGKRVGPGNQRKAETVVHSPERYILSTKR